MIVFLTLCYCGFLFLLVKFGVIKLTLWWKISPLVWMLALLIFLFVPMQSTVPAGKVNVYQYVIEVIPSVSGEVVDVPAQGLASMEEGDVLFQIDPVPFQAAVDLLEADLAAAIQDVERLQVSADAAASTVVRTEEEMDVIKSEQDAAAATVSAAEAAVAEANALRERAETQVEDLQLQLRFARSERDRIRQLVAQEAATQSELDRIELNYTSLDSQLNGATADVVAAEQTVARTEADVLVAQATGRTVDVRLRQLIDADLPRAEAQQQEARLAADSTIDDVHTSVARVQAQLVSAEYDLAHTTVRAPSDGFVIGATLRAGQRVTNFPVRSWMAFVDSRESRLAVGINQNGLRHVQPGQEAEVVLKLFPGQTFQAVVEDIAYITPSGQLHPAGDVPMAPTAQDTAIPYGVLLKLEEGAPEIADLPGGAAGTAAIYTDVGKPTHAIRRIMLRMESWMNYIVPW